MENLSWHPFLIYGASTGNDPVDEDVDIGGNDPPVSSYPPVEIEKDAAHKNSKCSSSSSSSSESGSSSSGLYLLLLLIFFLFSISCCVLQMWNFNFLRTICLKSETLLGYQFTIL